MAENSKIEWCHHTFNPWRGCRALSDACANCYAKVLVEGRLQQDFGVRTRAAASTWKQPIAWNRKAEREGRRMRVFCASLADVFDAEVPDAWRDELFSLIAVTPHLDWLLLTKRPAVARKVMPATPLPNVWLGTTVENQAMAETRIPHLLATPAAVRFLSMEPLLGPVDLTAIPWRFNGATGEPVRTVDALRGVVATHDPVFAAFGASGVAPARLDWVITGGESGPGARPSHPDWFRSIRDQCAAAGVPFLFKQWGEWGPWIARDGVFDPKAVDGFSMARLGKKAAGRHLDGVLHDGYPVVG